MPKPKITLNKEWLDGLVEVIECLAEQTAKEKSLRPDTIAWLSHLGGYIHSLDNHFKE